MVYNSDMQKICAIERNKSEKTDRHLHSLDVRGV